MNIIFHCVCLLALGFAGSAFAQPIAVRQADQIDLLNHTPPMVYRDQMVISVRTTSQTQLDAMLALTESVWTENTGIGPLDIQIKRSSLNAITALGIPHDVLIEDLQAHTTAGWNRIVEIERQEQEAQVINQGQRGGGVHDDAWFANYKQLNDITAYINNIVAARPDMASPSFIGQSYEGRDMFAITISAPDSIENPLADRPAIFIFSTVHAREWIAPMTTAYFASKLIEDYDTDPRVHSILDSARIVIVPMGNPDGYQYTWTNERYWRKTRRDNGNGSFGVDINRNWGYEWGGQGASDNPGDNTYHGTAPFSEPETSNLRDTALGFGDQLIAHMEYHSYSQLVMHPWGYSSIQLTEPDRTYFELLTNELANEIYSVHEQSYVPQQASDLYRHAGNSPDWFYGELGITSLLIELRPRNADFDPHPSNILPCAQENYNAIKRYIERATEPLAIWHEPYESVLSGNDLELRANFLNNLGTLDPSSPTIFARVDPADTFTPYSMSHDEESQYFFNTQSITCGEIYEYYLQASTLDGIEHTYPIQGASFPLRTVPIQLVTAQVEDFETDTGWIVGDESDTATSGIWTRVDPDEVVTQQNDIAQPESNHTPYGTLCWVTDGAAGADENDRDVDNGTTTLYSPLFSPNGEADPIISFWYWFYRSDSNYDYLRLDISNDNGENWSTYNHYSNSGQQWKRVYVHIANLLEPTEHIKLRFVVFDNETDGVVEAAIDDLKIEFFGCPSTNPADLNNDGILNFFDISIFLNAFASQNPLADINEDGIIDFFDVSTFIIAFSDG